MPLFAKEKTWILVLMDHLVGRPSGYSRRVSPHGGPGPRPTCILLSWVTGTDTYRLGRPAPVPAHGRPLLDIGVNQSRTTPYHQQRNGVVEWNNRMLVDAFRNLLLGRGQEEWDVVLLQIMRAYRSTPHSSTQETLNLFMLGRETRVPEHLTYHVPAPESPVHDYVGKLIEIMGKAHDALRAQQ